MYSYLASFNGRNYFNSDDIKRTILTSINIEKVTLD